LTHTAIFTRVTLTTPRPTLSGEALQVVW